MDWDNPADRAELILRVGRDEYHRQQEAHLESTTVETVNGYPLRPVQTMFGRLIRVAGTTMAFSTIEQARDHAAKLPKPEDI